MLLGIGWSQSSGALDPVERSGAERRGTTVLSKCAILYVRRGKTTVDAVFRHNTVRCKPVSESTVTLIVAAVFPSGLLALLFHSTEPPILANLSRIHSLSTT